ncbi:sulfite exporter TauE/SafE family protein [Fulvivirgaceae bacterium PWU4]|uniref:Probable membrane transporter protein n=1 Tax=Chryseosolibacter histidini TaxID=2782349 RepID=A0AAP2DRA4_9BACT|nr:sulfite exporter TauE/SafE family protein [Chryseosolibacter histidini]MBT1699797.1 sulfite exporter TauE/SafE family protein [Chryseosolibacter histidini]
MEILGYIASVCIGLILGLLGGGGSILSIPILVYLFHVDAITASAYSLFIVGITSFVGAIPKYKEHLVNVRTGLAFGIPSIISIFSTRRWIVPAIPDVIWQTESFVFTKRILVLGIFALLMILASFSMIRGRKELASDDQGFRTFLVVVEGIVIGFLTGLVGAGGGFLIIPALVFLTGLPFKTAVGTSLFIIAINSLMGFLGDVLNYTMDWPFLFSITLLAVTGILVGNRLQKKISSMKLRKAFGWLTLLMGSWILLREVILI